MLYSTRGARGRREAADQHASFGEQSARIADFLFYRLETTATGKRNGFFGERPLTAGERFVQPAGGADLARASASP